MCPRYTSHDSCFSWCPLMFFIYQGGRKLSFPHYATTSTCISELETSACPLSLVVLFFSYAFLDVMAVFRSTLTFTDEQKGPGTCFRKSPACSIIPAATVWRGSLALDQQEMKVVGTPFGHPEFCSTSPPVSTKSAFHTCRMCRVLGCYSCTARQRVLTARKSSLRATTEDCGSACARFFMTPAKVGCHYLWEDWNFAVCCARGALLDQLGGPMSWKEILRRHVSRRGTT